MKIFRTALTCWILATAVAGVAVAAAHPAVPSPVSPGDSRGIARIGQTCPTFSWDPVPGARAHEIAIYAVERGRDVAGARPVLEQRLPGAASSWTPSLARCLARGEAYAWAVRAVTAKGAGEWSDPRVFRVRATPTEAEFENALDLVRRYLEERGELAGASTAGVAAVPPAGAEFDDAAGASSAAAQGGMTRMAPSEFSVDASGHVSGSTFSGDGSGLTNVDAELLDGLDSSFFAEGTHMHTPEEISTGTEFVLVSPIETATCAGTSGATSTCTTADCINGVRVGGGCTFHADTTCNEAGRAITSSAPAGTEAWQCSVVCNDASGTVKAEGSVFCPVEAVAGGLIPTL